MFSCDPVLIKVYYRLCYVLGKATFRRSILPEFRVPENPCSELSVTKIKKREKVALT